MVQDQKEAWCIAKLSRLIGPISSFDIKPEYEAEFRVAAYLLSETYKDPQTGLKTPFINNGTLRDELAKFPGPEVSRETIEFLEYLLIVEHSERPTAAEALRHPFLQTEKDVK